MQDLSSTIKLQIGELHSKVAGAEFFK